MHAKATLVQVHSLKFPRYMIASACRFILWPSDCLVLSTYRSGINKRPCTECRKHVCAPPRPLGSMLRYVKRSPANINGRLFIPPLTALVLLWRPNIDCGGRGASGLCISRMGVYLSRTGTTWNVPTLIIRNLCLLTIARPGPL